MGISKTKVGIYAVASVAKSPSSIGGEKSAKVTFECPSFVIT